MDSNPSTGLLLLIEKIGGKSFTCIHLSDILVYKRRSMQASGATLTSKPCAVLRASIAYQMPSKTKIKKLWVIFRLFLLQSWKTFIIVASFGLLVRQILIVS